MVVCRLAGYCLSAAALSRLAALAALLLCCLWLAGCSSALRWTPDTHTVQSGETLYSIARRYNLDHRQLAAWNGLGDGSFIRAGQQLRLTAPASGSAVSSSAGTRPSRPATAVPPGPSPPWQWPTVGQVREGFGATPRTASGVRITGVAGQPVVAAAAGEVVYAGGGLPSYGQLLILKHDGIWISAYGFNSQLLVREGDRVRAGQTIAQMGTEPSGLPTLHFEIRRNGQPLDPLVQLPVRQ